MNNNKKIISKIDIIVITILIFITYPIISYFLSKSEIAFRNGAFISSVISINILIVMLIKFFKNDIFKNFKNKLTKLILIVLSIGIIQFFTTLGFRFIINQEVYAYREGKLFITTADAVGFHKSNINFYEPLNTFFMKKADIESFLNRSPRNLYDTIDNTIYETSEIDVLQEFDFSHLNPFIAKKKFGHAKFQYLGNKTYDFGGISIKFNDLESDVEEAFITRDLVKYKEKKVIGEDINVLKSYIEKNAKNEGKAITYNEFFDEKGNKNINLIEKNKYGTDYSLFYFILNNDDIITSVKFINNLS